MGSGAIAFYIVMGWTLLITGGLTYLIVKQKNYDLISGFGNKTKEEQEQLIQNGYPQAIGKVLLHTWIILLISFILGIFQVPYGFGIGLAIYLIYLLVGMVYVQKYYLVDKRKKYGVLTSVFSLIVLLGVGGLAFAGFQDEKPEVKDGVFKIHGMYGVEWPIEDIDEVTLLDKLPEVKLKSNGFAAAGRLKGSFRLEEPYGKGKLFVHKGYSPYLYIQKDDEYLILNRKNQDELYELMVEIQSTNK
ncbi:hypothetical protein GCM10008967_36290 [Bacillus carboniphilus]|uniref:DUF3784 domain-containing protein n=1 Tax=Bacillus carboniphilus TaxID=86663 RepID=A0ABP3GD69_9BACI